MIRGDCHRPRSCSSGCNTPRGVIRDGGADGARCCRCGRRGPAPALASHKPQEHRPRIMIQYHSKTYTLMRHRSSHILLKEHRNSPRVTAKRFGGLSILAPCLLPSLSSHGAGVSSNRRNAIIEAWIIHPGAHGGSRGPVAAEKGR